MALLTAEEKELLTKAANLMDELLETLEVMQDKELVKDLKIALKEVKEGKDRPLNELIKELKLEDEIYNTIYAPLLKGNQTLDREV